MVQPMFCKSQIYAKGNSKSAHTCREDDPEAQLFCTAHLCESASYQCPYKPSEIYQEEDGTIRIAHKNSQGDLEGRCEDFRILDKWQGKIPIIKYPDISNQPPRVTSTSSTARHPKSRRLILSHTLVFKNFTLTCNPPKNRRIF